MASTSSTAAIIVAGTSSGVGKTTVAVGLMHTLSRAGNVVQPFKIGPDFLDPMHHKAATGLPSVNLDGWMLGREGCVEAFHAAMATSGANIAVIEGCMGLHDGRDGKSDVGSTAQMAKYLNAPVVLVVDAWNLARSAAAMVFGYKMFDPEVRLAGVIFNRVAGIAHGEWIRQAMESASATAEVVVLGCLPSDKRLATPERLLGLLPPPTTAGVETIEDSSHAKRLASLHTLISGHIDMNELKLLAASADPPPPPLSSQPRLALLSSSDMVLPPVRIAVAQDAAFCFVYTDNLRLLEQAGATIISFSPLADEALPADADALYLVGGYPELHASRLAANATMRAAVLAFCESGRFVWAECGGLMYLAQELVLRPEDVVTAREAKAMCEAEMCTEVGAVIDSSSSAVVPSTTATTLVHAMCGWLPFEVTMTPRMVMGYCKATLCAPTASLLQLPIDNTQLRCQQYHFSEATVDGEPAVLVDAATGGGAGIRGVDQHAFDVCMEVPAALPAPEGSLCKRTVATYCHVHFGADPQLAPAFVRAARRSQLVVSTLPSATEMLCVLLDVEEVQRRLIGISEHCDYPAELVTSCHVVSRSAVELRDDMSGAEVDAALTAAKEAGLASAHVLDVQWLATHRPGLVLTQDTCLACDAAAGSVHAALVAAGLGREGAVTINPRTVGQMFASMRLLGDALGLAPEATGKVVGQLEARLAHVRAAVAGAVPGRGPAAIAAPRVLGLESLCPLVASGQWLPGMRERAGAIDALGDTEGAAARVVDWHEIAASEADVIVVCCCGRSAAGAVEEVKEHMLSRPELRQKLPALRTNPPRLYVVPHEPFSRPGPRLIDGIEMLTALLHPSCLSADFVARATANVLRLANDCEHFEPMVEASTTVTVSTTANAVTTAVASTLVPSSMTAASSTEVPTAVEPAVRSAATLVCTDEGSLILFGGEASMESTIRDHRGMGDVWSMGPPAGGWVTCSAPEPAWQGPWACGAAANEDVPTHRSNHAAVACGDHMLVFGGWSSDGSTPLAHPELLHLQTHCWTHCSTRNAPPPPRGNPSLVYSRHRHGAILYAGWNRQQRFDDVWCLDMESWRWHAAAQSGLMQPRARTDHAAVLWEMHADQERMLVFGGSTELGASDELWALDCSGEPALWTWTDDTSAKDSGPWPPGRTSHAAAIAGSGSSASLVIVGGQDQALGPAAAAIVSDAWVLSPLGSPQRTWSQLSWRGTFPLQRCRHSLVILGEYAIVYGGYDGAHTLDKHHSVFCTSVALSTEETANKHVTTSVRESAAENAQGKPSQHSNRHQERWTAERPLSEVDLPPEERARAAKSKLPLAMAKALHRQALKLSPQRDTYIDPDTGYSVFTQAYLKRRPCCGNGCRHCPWGHMNVPGKSRSKSSSTAACSEKKLEW